MNNQFSRSGRNWPDTPLSIGAAVRQARRNHGLTQTQLAGLAGTGLRFISELERGKPSVALDKTLSVLAVLGLRIQISAAKP
ncbi:MAG TPA: helix-turn-helix transcriptional regulator [Pseudoxanthomonas sp.]|nr:helix-turn-helix transcriptional regulator [Pseudoxanthomonas sp.]